MDNYELSRAIVARLSEIGCTLSTAESLTGGLLGASITGISGSSAVYKGGIISYCNEIKHSLLDVPEEVLERYYAVSAETARAMAEGARKKCDTDFALSTTGIAGPNTDESGQPVGLVYIGFSSAEMTEATCFQFTGTRDQIRNMVCNTAFQLLLQKITEG